MPETWGRVDPEVLPDELGDAAEESVGPIEAPGEVGGVERMGLPAHASILDRQIDAAALFHPLHRAGMDHVMGELRMGAAYREHLVERDALELTLLPAGEPARVEGDGAEWEGDVDLHEVLVMVLDPRLGASLAVGVLLAGLPLVMQGDESESVVGAGDDVHRLVVEASAGVLHIIQSRVVLDLVQPVGAVESELLFRHRPRVLLQGRGA